MVEIRPIQVHEIEEAKQLIFRMGYEIFGESIEAQRARGRLKEMDDIRRNYFDNGGTFLVACEGGRIIGTGGIRRWEDSVCELKRLWVTWEFHGQGVGHRLMQELISIARAKGYKKMRLETNPVYQARAVAFYKKLGFREIPPYGEHPDELAMELDL